MQCMVTATTAVGAASGMRSVIAARLGERLGPNWMRGVTIALMSAAVVASALFASGSGG
jgi:hypothetical protein